MNLSTFDMNLLVALEALLEEQSVGGAARRLRLSQPAMSHALRRLREALEDDLLVRDGVRMQRTARGESLRAPLREALERVRDLVTSDAFDSAKSGRNFRIYVADNAMDLVLSPLLARLERVAPSVRVELVSWRDRDAEVLDVAVACVPEKFPGFYRERLFTDRDACALRDGHPFARRLRRKDAFLSARHVAVRVHGAVADPVDTWLQEQGLARNVVVTVPHYVQALHAVARSDLVAVLPERLIRAYRSELSVKWMPLPIDPGTFDEFLLHPPRTHRDTACVWLRGVLKGLGKELA